MFGSSKPVRLVVRLAMSLLLVCVSVASANAQTVFYWGPNPVNYEWSHVLNWSPIGFPSGTNTAAVIDGDNYSGDDPVLSGNIVIAGLTLRDNGELYITSSGKLTVNPGTGGVGRTNIQAGGGLDIWSGGVFDTDELNIDGTLYSNGLVQVDKKCEIRSGGVFLGRGTFQMAGSEYLYNEGTIEANTPWQTLEINRLSGSRFNWDGLSENGRLKVVPNATLFINMPPTDTFSGTIEVSGGGTFKTQAAWSIGGPNARMWLNSGKVQGGGVNIRGGSIVAGSGLLSVPVNVQGGRLYSDTGNLRLTQDSTSDPDGYVQVNPGMQLNVEAKFDHMGDLHCYSGGIVNITAGGDFMMLDGTMNVYGMLAIDPSGSFDVAGGRLVALNVDGDLDIAGGILALEPYQSGPPALMTINGNYMPTGSTKLEIDIAGPVAGTDYDQVVVNGDAVLGGDLEILLDPNLQLTRGDKFTIVTVSGTRTGTFNGMNHGARVGNQNGVNLYINYKGGDGNDVEITTINPRIFPNSNPTHLGG